MPTFILKYKGSISKIAIEIPIEKTVLILSLSANIAPKVLPIRSPTINI